MKRFLALAAAAAALLPGPARAQGSFHVHMPDVGLAFGLAGGLVEVTNPDRFNGVANTAAVTYSWSDLQPASCQTIGFPGGGCGLCTGDPTPNGNPPTNRCPFAGAVTILPGETHQYWVQTEPGEGEYVLEWREGNLLGILVTIAKVGDDYVPVSYTQLLRDTER